MPVSGIPLRENGPTMPNVRQPGEPDRAACNDHPIPPVKVCESLLRMSTCSLLRQVVETLL